jgi:hypothetical protein
VGCKINDGMGWNSTGEGGMAKQRNLGEGKVKSNILKNISSSGIGIWYTSILSPSAELLSAGLHVLYLRSI